MDKYLEWGILEAWVIPFMWMPGGHHYHERGIRQGLKGRRGRRLRYGPRPYREMPSWVTIPALS